MADLGRTSSGMQANIAGVLCYLAGFITGIIFYVSEKENKFVRFHAFQSIAVFGAFFVLSVLISFFPFLGWLFGRLLLILSLILWLLLMYMAYRGVCFKLPIAGKIAERNS